MRFRQLTLPDLDALADLFENNRLDSVAYQFNPFPLDRSSAQNLLQIDSQNLVFGLFEGPKLLGMTMLRGFDEGYEIPSFGILIDHQNTAKGLGTRITEWTLFWADQVGIPKVRLSVFSDNAPGIRLYEKMGFVCKETNGTSSERTKLVMIREIRTPKIEVFASLQAIRPAENLTDRINLWNQFCIHNIECTYYPTDQTFDSLSESLCRRNGKSIIHNYFPPEDPSLIVNLASPNPSEASKTIDYLNTAIERSASIGARWLSFHAGFIHDSNGQDEFGFTFPEASPKEREKALDRFCQNLLSLAQQAKEHKVKLLVENNVCAAHNKDKLLLCTPADFEQFFDTIDHDNIFMLLDTGHLNVSAKTYGFRVSEVEHLRDRIAGVHLHQNDGTADTHDFVTSDSWPTRLAKKLSPEFVSLEGRHDTIDSLQTTYLSIYKNLNE